MIHNSYHLLRGVLLDRATTPGSSRQQAVIQPLLENAIKYGQKTRLLPLGIANLRKSLLFLFADQAQLTFERTATAVRAYFSIPISGTA